MMKMFMSSRNFQKPIKIKGRRLVITKKMIEDAQANTKSNMAASRWLGINYLTYRKYARIYGIFEKHLNPSGVGIKKGYGKWQKPLDELLSRERTYKLRPGYIKKRLLAENWVPEECNSCGYNEIVMGKDKVALRLDFVDDNVLHTHLDNIRLLCPNCYLSYNGHMPSSERFYK